MIHLLVLLCLRYLPPQLVRALLDNFLVYSLLSVPSLLSFSCLFQVYPYLAEESGSCSFAEGGVGAGVMRSVNITFQDEAELLEAVGNTGPVSVAFQVNGSTLVLVLFLCVSVCSGRGERLNRKSCSLT